MLYPLLIQYCCVYDFGSFKCLVNSSYRLIHKYLYIICVRELYYLMKGTFWSRLLLFLFFVKSTRGKPTVQALEYFESF